MVLRPTELITSSKAILASVISSIRESNNCPLDFANCSMLAAAIFSSAIDDMVRFTHGGGVLSKNCFWRIDSTEPAPPPPLNLQLRPGRPLDSSS
jgi:hypothetical protein